MIRYAITNRRGSGLPEVEQVSWLVQECARLAREGVDLLLLREKDLPPQELAEVSRRVLQAVRAVGGRTRLLVHSHLGVALSIGADGMHLSANWTGPDPSEIRRRFRGAGLPEPSLSVSCHHLDEVRRARAAGFSAILFGPVFGKVVGGAEVVPGIGLDALRAACEAAAPVPVLALGGIAPARIPKCLAAGAAGVAAIRMFFPQGS
jgi:thiamine-phosphate pyrophosphorylase